MYHKCCDVSSDHCLALLKVFYVSKAFESNITVYYPCHLHLFSDSSGSELHNISNFSFYLISGWPKATDLLCSNTEENSSFDSLFIILPKYYERG